MATDDAKKVLVEFLAAYWEDRVAGSVRALGAYLQAFPGADDVVAAEYLRLRPADPEEPSDGQVAPTTLAQVSPAGTADTERIGPYRILRRIGRGGQGTVYLAKDERLHRQVALKVLAGLGTISADATRRFQREAEVASRLEHPGICTIYDAGVDHGIPYIAMRYVEGETLAARISTTREGLPPDSSVVVFLPEGSREPCTVAGADHSSRPGAPMTPADFFRIVRLVEQVARALHVAHESGVIHRDVKPGNIMVGADGEPVILDFGLARDIEGDDPTLTRPGDLFGTPAYMSPEQLAQHRIRLDRRTDVWSLGVTLYECLTLRRPFEAPTREALYQSIMVKDPWPLRRVNPSIPKDLDAVVRIALDKDRDRRYQTSLDFAEDLRRVRTFEPIRARPAGPLLRFRRWYQRSPALATAVTALFLVLALGLGVTHYLLDRNTSQLAQITRLADVKRLHELRMRADGLCADFPDNLSGHDQWLREARTLLDRLPIHSTTLAAMDARGSTTTEERWQRDVLAGLVADLESFPATHLAIVESRAERARLRLSNDPERTAAWDRALAAINREPAYSGVKIPHQAGLVPIGPDPESKLWEFAHPLTGEVPVRDPDTGRFGLTGETGIILVLLPGGNFWLGAQHQDRDLPNRDPEALADETPVHQVRLSPFFISKYETTQGQWRRLMGTNPSNPAAPGSPIEGSLACPVEQVSWDDCHDACVRMGFRIPTEAEWEYACRAGTSTPRYGNLDDIAWHVENSGGVPHRVGAKSPNALGLYDMLGGVFEWCSDWYTQDEYARHVESQENPHGPASGHGRVVRGGSLSTGSPTCRASARYWYKAGVRYFNLGFRPCRTP